MRKHIIWMITLGSLFSLTAAYGQANRTQQGWHNIVARDVTFQLQLPAGWQEMGPETLESFQAVSEQGESLTSGLLQVYEHEYVLRPNLVANKYLVPPAQLILMSRLLSDPLTPAEVLTKLFPQIANGAIQNVRILRTHDLPAAPGGLSAMLLYQYTLFPDRDPAFAASLPPTLRRHAQVPMRAWAVISTDGGNGLTWGLTYGVIAAPQPVFDNNQATYVRIYQTYEFIREGLLQKIHNNAQAAQLAEELTQNTHRVAQMMRDDEGLFESGRRVAGALGGDTIFKGAGVEGKLPTPEVQSNTPYVICYETGPTPIPETQKPLSAHCTPAKQ